MRSPRRRVPPVALRALAVPGPRGGRRGIAAVAGGSSVCVGSLWALSSRGGAGKAVPSIGEVEENSVLPRAPRQSPEELVCTQPNGGLT